MDPRAYSSRRADSAGSSSRLRAPPPPARFPRTEKTINRIRANRIKQGHDRRTGAMFKGYFAKGRKASTLNLGDWNGFIRARRERRTGPPSTVRKAKKTRERGSEARTGPLRGRTGAAAVQCRGPGEPSGGQRTGETLAHLGKIGALRVTSRTSAVRFKGRDKSIREISRELGVAHVLEGSFRAMATGSESTSATGPEES